MDLSKAFDKVNHYALNIKLATRCIPVEARILRKLVFLL